MSTLVHKGMLYIQTSLQILQHLNFKNFTFECFILCNKMMYFGDFVVLVPYISSEFIFIT